MNCCPSNSTNCPIPTIEDFKTQFAKVFRFSPYEVWTQTTYDKGAQVNLDGRSYVSLIDNNSTMPTVPTEEPAADAEPATWDILNEYNPDLPTWVAPIAYPKDDEVLWLNKKTWTWGVYKSLVEDNYAVPSDPDSWQQDTLVELNTFVMDSDITEAMREASTIVPHPSPMSCDDYQLCFLLMTAHFVITDWQAANMGLNASGTGGILTSRTAGKMSAGYAVSPILAKFPQYQMYLTTPWGLKAITTLMRYNVGNVLGFQGKFTSY